MSQDLKKLFAAVIEEEKKKRNAEIRALQYKINPHFLYNTLASIRFLALKQNSNEVSDIILLLGKLLKNTISKDSFLIPVCEEIQNIKDYLSIEQLCYDNRIKIGYNIDDSVLSYKLPLMLLEPIVENAIMHGLNERINNNQAPEILISAFEQNDYICFEVRDNGIGMTKEQIDNILYDQADESKYRGVHIGIKNTYNRIISHFGNRYGITITSEPGSYTIVKLKLPKISGEERSTDAQSAHS